MNDFIKLETDSCLLGNKNLDPQHIVNANTGEIESSYLTSKLKNLKIKHLAKKTIIQGSIHKYLHGVNYNQFSYNHFKSASIDLFNTLKLNPYTTKVTNLEFGVNILLPESIKCSSFIDSCLSYKGKKFNYKEFANNAKYKEMELQQYKVKIYDKGTQVQKRAPLIGNLLRFEVHSFKSVFLQSNGIEYYSDLLQPKKYYNLLKRLKNAFDTIFFNNWSEHPSELINSHKELLKDWLNDATIQKLQKSNPDRYKYQMKKFKELEFKYSANTDKEKVWKLIENKWNELMYLDLKSYTKLTDFLSSFPESNLHQINNSSLGLIQYNFISSDLARYLLMKQDKKEPKKCLVTGLDISNQKSNSKFLSANQIGYYEAHRLRNLMSNPRNNLLRKIKRIEAHSCNQLLKPSISLTKEQFDLIAHLIGTKNDPLQNINYGIR